jgi:hypothetical protein
MVYMVGVGLGFTRPLSMKVMWRTPHPSRQRATPHPSVPAPTQQRNAIAQATQDGGERLSYLQVYTTMQACLVILLLDDASAGFTSYQRGGIWWP